MHRPVDHDRLGAAAEDVRGLAAVEAAERFRRFGPNQILESSSRRWSLIAAETARDPMLWFLGGSGMLYLSIGDATEAVVLWLAIVPLLVMDGFLHWRTEASTEGLRTRLASRTIVIRDGETAEIDALGVVPGDLIVISAGDHLPADGVLVDGAEVQIDESALTGESHPVRKRPWTRLDPLGEEMEIDGAHWAFAGTRLLTGSARVRIVYTGADTLYGEIVRTAMRGPGRPTPLQRAIARLVAALTFTAALFCLVLALVRLRQGHGWIDSLVSAATLAVAALPEEFPIVFAFFLGLGVYRLARRKALVRRATSVENIGRATTLLSDKTGTITTGELTLTDVLPVDGTDPVDLLRLAAVASRRAGDPLDDAIYRALEERRIEPPAGDLVATFPFTEVRRRETAVLRHAGGGAVAASKGAVEALLRTCDLSASESATWTRSAESHAGRARKVIACASREIDLATWNGTEPFHGLRFAGLLVFGDPVRDGVAHAVEICRDAGIHPILVTGDHPAAARAVALEIGLGDGQPVVFSGDEIERKIADGGIGRVDVVARAMPAQKLALLRALQDDGEIVVVTGDGVNDVPALQAADVGVAMGRRGTRSAREVASIVLLDDDFGTLVHAISEGRQLFRNLRLSFEYLVLIHIPLVVTAALIPVLGYPLLYLPLHIVWLELIIHPTAMLVFQGLPPPGRLASVRRDVSPRFFSAGEWILLVGTGGVAALFVTFGYLRSLEATGSVEHARAIGLTFLVAWSTGCAGTLSRLRTRLARWTTAIALLTSLAAIESPPIARLLHLRSLPVEDAAIALVGGLVAAAAACLGLARTR